MINHGKATKKGKTIASIKFIDTIIGATTATYYYQYVVADIGSVFALIE